MLDAYSIVRAKVRAFTPSHTVSRSHGPSRARRRYLVLDVGMSRQTAVSRARRQCPALDGSVPRKTSVSRARQSSNARHTMWDSRRSSRTRPSLTYETTVPRVGVFFSHETPVSRTRLPSHVREGRLPQDPHHTRGSPQL